jgi:hypothetical protein
VTRALIIASLLLTASAAQAQGISGVTRRTTTLERQAAARLFFDAAGISVTAGNAAAQPMAAGGSRVSPASEVPGTGYGARALATQGRSLALPPLATRVQPLSSRPQPRPFLTQRALTSRPVIPLVPPRLSLTHPVVRPRTSTNHVTR